MTSKITPATSISDIMNIKVYNPPLLGWIRRIKYKPGFYFKIEGHALIIDVTISDRDTLESKTLSFHHALPREGFESEHHFFKFVKENIVWLEMHELDEFFKIDGKRVCDPHLDPYEKHAQRIAEATYRPRYDYLGVREDKYVYKISL